MSGIVEEGLGIPVPGRGRFLSRSGGEILEGASWHEVEIASESADQVVQVGEKIIIEEGGFVNRMFDSRAGLPGANVSGPIGRSFSPGSGIPTTASEGIKQRGLNVFYPNNAQEAIIYRAKEAIPAVQRTSIGGTAPEILIEPQHWSKLEVVRQFSVIP